MKTVQEYEVMHDCVCKTLDDYYFELDQGDVVCIPESMADELLKEGVIKAVGVRWQ